MTNIKKGMYKLKLRVKLFLYKPKKDVKKPLFIYEQDDKK